MSTAMRRRLSKPIPRKDVQPLLSKNCCVESGRKRYGASGAPGAHWEIFWL